MRAPILLCLAGIGFVTVMNGLVKALAGDYDPLQIALLRYACGTVWVAMVVAWERPRWPDSRNFPAHLARGVLGALSGTAFFYGLRELVLADAFTIGFLAPLFVTLLSLLLLREWPRPVDILALVLGVAGMLIIVTATDAPGGPRPLFGVLAVVVSAVTYALTLVMLRALAQKDAISVLVLFQHSISALLLLIPGALVWRWMPPGDLALVALAALFGVLGHLMMGRAYARAAAARLAPLEYSALIYAAAIDLVWFGHPLSGGTLLGACAIILGTLLASRR